MASSSKKIVTQYSHEFLTLRLEDPVQIGKNKLSCNILNCGEKFYIQTPRLLYSNSNLSFKGKNQNLINEFYEFILEIEKQIESKSQNIISKLVEPQDDDDSAILLKSSITTPSKLSNSIFLKTKLSDTFECYNRKIQPIDLSEFTKEKEAKFIILCDHIIITPTHIEISWKLVQALVYIQKNKSPKGFAMMAEESDGSLGHGGGDSAGLQRAVFKKKNKPIEKINIELN